MAPASSEQQLADAFERHLEETNGQIERIDKIETCDLKLERMKCVAMED